MDTLIEIGIDLVAEGVELVLELLFDPAWRAQRKEKKEKE